MNILIDPVKTHCKGKNVIDFWRFQECNSYIHIYHFFLTICMNWLSETNLSNTSEKKSEVLHSKVHVAGANSFSESVFQVALHDHHHQYPSTWPLNLVYGYEPDISDIIWRNTERAKIDKMKVGQQLLFVQARNSWLSNTLWSHVLSRRTTKGNPRFSEASGKEAHGGPKLQQCS